MDKKYESLKIRYENTRTWLLTLVALALSMSIGYYTIEDITFKLQLGRITAIVVLAIIVLYIIQTFRYKRALEYLAG